MTRNIYAIIAEESQNVGKEFMESDNTGVAMSIATAKFEVLQSILDKLEGTSESSSITMASPQYTTISAEDLVFCVGKTVEVNGIKGMLEDAAFQTDGTIRTSITQPHQKVSIFVSVVEKGIKVWLD